MLTIFGAELVDRESISQMEGAIKLPVAVRAALMPDSHVGYGIPIGGVLATENAVIPYAVGVDIACRVKLTVFNLPGEKFHDISDRLEEALRKRTFFGVGVENPLKEYHPVLDDPSWGDSKFLLNLKDLARKQLGTSGSGNHFVEFGIIKFIDNLLHFKPGQEYLALVSHSGSRGLGSKICQHYSELARKICKGKSVNEKLAWLPIPGEGEEYWNAMELAGKYASANHELIHRRLAEYTRLEPIFSMENHHNFAWRETVEGRNLIVHRKGATPAQEGVLGFIPGTMADPGFLVRGKGNIKSLNSSAHGAGRVLSRRKAKSELDYAKDVLETSAKKGVRVIRAGRDESPLVYKNIREVIAAQQDCVEILAEFQPKLVIMAGDDEEAED